MDTGSVGGIVGLIIGLAIGIAVIAAYVKILHRTGHSGWWVLVGFVPLVNIVMLCVFAWSRWPAVDHKAS